jgi:branched-chain amino acid transport system permease protein
MVGALVFIVLLLLPLAVPSAQLGLPTEVFLFALFAVTYDLIFGFAGLISFGHALFIGTGAYALAIAMTNYHLPLALAFVVVLVTGFFFSSTTGLLALRTRGIYFAMVTLAFAQAAYTLAESNIDNLTGGENGLPVQGASSWWMGPSSGLHFYYVALFALAFGFLLMWLFVLSPAGRVWQAIRENEQRAFMIGYHPYPFKLLAYVISGTIATLVGGLYALFISDVSPNLLSADQTIALLLMVIIGGAGSLWGAMIGAALIRYLDHYLNVLSTSSFVSTLPNWLHQLIGQPLLIFGIIYLLLVVFFPQGIAGLVRRWVGGELVIAQAGLGDSATTITPSIQAENVPSSITIDRVDRSSSE